MAKYGSFKYGSQKYGAHQTVIAKTTASISMDKGMFYFKLIVSNIYIKIYMSRITKFLKSIVAYINAKNMISKHVNKNISAKVSPLIFLNRMTSKALNAISALKIDIKKQSRLKITTDILASALPINKVSKKILTAFKKVTSFIGRYFTVYPELSFEEYEIILGVINMPVAGGTITLKATFPDKAGNLAELNNVQVKIYAPGRRLLKTLTPIKLSTGVYSVEYTIPENIVGQFDYEFSGELGLKTIVGRSSFESVWRS